MTESTKRKWTGGKWFFTSHEPSDNLTVASLDDGDLKPVAEIFDHGDIVETRANANLFASSKRLFEACEAGLDELQHWYDDHSQYEEEPDTLAVLEKLKAALSAALGKVE